MGLNQNQLFNAQETFEDFKVLLIRYKQVKDDENKLKSLTFNQIHTLKDKQDIRFHFNHHFIVSQRLQSLCMLFLVISQEYYSLKVF